VRVRIFAALAVGLLAVGFACLPFHSQERGMGGRTNSCRAPIFIGWTGGHPYTTIKGRTEYNSSQQCGYDARQRLVVSGIVVCLALAALAFTVWRGLRKRYPLPSYW
jgi:hypothetical protein